MKVVGLMYGEFLGQNAGAPPANEAAFAKFLEREPEYWNKLAPTVAQFLQSPRDQKPLRIVYGAKLKTPDDGSLPWVACESEGVAGTRMIVNIRGSVRTVADKDLGQYFTDI